MKKIIVILLLLLSFAVPVFAEDEEKSSAFEMYIEKQIVVHDNTGLLLAIKNNDKDYIKKMLNTGYNPDSSISKIPLVFFVVYFDRPEILKIFFDYGANVNITCFGESAFDFAIYRNTMNCVKVFVENKVDINKKCLGDTPLNYALACKHYEIANYLIEKGATLDNKSVRLIKKSKNDILKNLIK